MIQLKNVNFTYQGAETGGLHGLDLTIPDGQVLVLCGESGCGKTTLTRLLNGLIPHVFPGELTGSVTVDGRDVSHQPLYDTARLVGSVFQNPRSQFFNVDTTSEITFGCENLGLPKDEILRRLDAAVPALGLRKLLGRGIFQLSGGEKQKIACAGAFLMEPPVFVLDEPSANLDADAVLELRGVLKTLKALGKTVILSEHRLYYLRGLADRYLYLRDGRVQGDYSGVEFDAIPAEERRAMGLRAGSLADLTLREEPDIRRGTAQLRDFRFAYKNAPEAQRIDGGHPLRRHRGHPGPQRGGEVHLLPLLLRPGEAPRHRDGGRHRSPPQGPAGPLLHGDAGRGASALHRERPGRGAPQHAGGGRDPGQGHPGPAGSDALSGPAPGVPLRRAEAAAGRRLRPGGGAERGLPG